MAYKSGHIYLIDHEPNSEELATFTKPVQFDVCISGLYYSILYDKDGNKFVEDRSQIVTGFIKIGEITQIGNQITIGVHPSGFNHWRINGVDITSNQPTVLEIDPVADGQFRFDWIIGNSAGGLFILQGVAGKFPIKPNPLNFPQFAFFLEISVTPDGLGGIAELNLANVFTGNGNDTPLDVKDASATQRGTMSTTHWSKLEGINLSNYVLNSALTTILADYATNIALSSGLANKYSITTTNITAPDATYQWMILTDGVGVTRRLNFATYLSTTLSSYATSSDLTTGLNNRYVIATTSIATPDATYIYVVMTSAAGVTRRLDLSTYLAANFATSTALALKLDKPTTAITTSDTTYNRITFLDSNGLTKYYSTTSTADHILQFNASGQPLAPIIIEEEFETDADLISAVYAATFTNSIATISVAGKTLRKGKMIVNSDTGVLYKCFLDNTVIRK